MLKALCYPCSLGSQRRLLIGGLRMVCGARLIRIALVLFPSLCTSAPLPHRALPLPIHPSGRTPLNSLGVAMGDSFPLNHLANVEASYGGEIAFGDTDHDGANEVVLTGLANTYRIWEHQGSNAYTLQDSGTSVLSVYAIGDVDQDGRSEIIGQTSGYVQVIESIEPYLHPSQLVWSSPYLSDTVGIPTIGDSDRDGRMEILQSINGTGPTSGLAIFESTSDNSFAWVLNATLVGPASTGQKLIADLDGDGKLEIALCGLPGWLHVFESPCDNVWCLTFREYTGLSNAYTMAGGRDTDGNGKPEMFVMGTFLGDYYATMVYESIGDNTFTRVSTIVMDPGVGSGGNAVVNIDGTGLEEYLASTSGNGVRVFRSTTIGNWDQVVTAYVPGHLGGVFDLNRNGSSEVIMQYFTTQIFEPPGTTANPPDDSGLHQNQLDITPNPCRVQATLRLTPQSSSVVTLAVFDIRGRVVERHAVVSSGAPILWQTASLPTGVYLLRLEDHHGRGLASARATIVR